MNKKIGEIIKKDCNFSFLDNIELSKFILMFDKIEFIHTPIDIDSTPEIKDYSKGITILLNNIQNYIINLYGTKILNNFIS